MANRPFPAEKAELFTAVGHPVVSLDDREESLGKCAACDTSIYRTAVGTRMGALERLFHPQCAARVLALLSIDPTTFQATLATDMADEVARLRHVVQTAYEHLNAIDADSIEVATYMLRDAIKLP